MTDYRDASHYHIRRELDRKTREALVKILEGVTGLPPHLRPDLRRRALRVFLAKARTIWDISAGLVDKELMDQIAETITALEKDI
jgi:hypothetical protein